MKAGPQLTAATASDRMMQQRASHIIQPRSVNSRRRCSVLAMKSSRDTISAGVVGAAERRLVAPCTCRWRGANCLTVQMQCAAMWANSYQLLHTGEMWQCKQLRCMIPGCAVQQCPQQMQACAFMRQSFAQVAGGTRTSCASSCHWHWHHLYLLLQQRLTSSMAGPQP